MRWLRVWSLCLEEAQRQLLRAIVRWFRKKFFRRATRAARAVVVISSAPRRPMSRQERRHGRPIV